MVRGWPQSCYTAGVRTTRHHATPENDSDGLNTHRWLRLIAAFSVLFCLLFTTPTVSSTARFDSIWVDDGLPGNLVWTISQDKRGFIWFGTSDGLARYDGYRMKTMPLPDSVKARRQVPNIRSIHVDSRDRRWIGTFRNGLFRHSIDDMVSVPLFDESADGTLPPVLAITEDVAERIWIGTGDGLYRLDETGSVETRFSMDTSLGSSLPGNRIMDLIAGDDGTIWVATNQGLARTTDTDGVFELIPLTEGRQPMVRSLHRDPGGSLWIGTSVGLFRESADELYEHMNEIGAVNVLAISSDEDSTWIGTQFNGLMRIEAGGMVQQFHYQPGVENGLSDSVILSLHTDHSGALWIGTFNGGVNRLDLASLKFGLHDDSASGIGCLPSRVIYALFEDSDGTTWAGSREGVVAYNQRLGLCRVFAEPATTESSPMSLTFSFFRDSQSRLWATTSRGLQRIDEQRGIVSPGSETLPATSTYFVNELADGRLLLGTSRGLYDYHLETDEATQRTTADNSLAAAAFIASARDSQERRWFATSRGLARLDRDGELMMIPQQSDIDGITLDSIHIDEQDNIWVGVERRGLAWLDSEGRLQALYPLGEADTPVSVVAGILPGRNGDLWVSTNRGLIRFDPASQSLQRYTARDGLQSEVFSRGVSWLAADGRLYFGGRKGFNAFYPGDIHDNRVPPEVVLTGFSRFNEFQSDQPSTDGFQLPGPIEYIRDIELSHRDYVVGIEFAALHYADPGRNRYRYIMDGFDPGWTEVGADKRHISYTNLPAGDYTFRVQAANKDGYWGNAGANLNVRVYPPPWASPLAIGLYVASLVLLTLLTIHLRTRAANRRAADLAEEVSMRTREVAEQKQTIEELLTRKNEMFANVSHEFRTPLTLILGPTESLMQTTSDPQHRTVLSMIRRNARRMLHLVNQLLNLARLEREESTQTVIQDVGTVLRYLVSAFESLAQRKGIQLSLHGDEALSVAVLPDSLETIVGNLISNAIKYTPGNGKVDVRYRRSGSQVQIEVEDNGPGISEKNSQRIFERFVRLDEHASEPGTGIGLALAREMSEALSGQLTLDSAAGRGSLFRLCLPHVDAAASETTVASEGITPLLDPDASAATDSQVHDQVQPSQMSEEKPALLIIEDNRDMQHFIRQSLEDSYHCLVAGNGHEGIELARQHMPDLVVSDVMMPGMDGFEVSRTLREDATTSHIPIILLTARGDKDSRMQGWREQVDEYLTKPFDADELRQRIHNLLAIRAILRQQAGEQLARGELPHQLNPCDQQFIDKLQASIADHYHNPLFGRPDLADLMAVSERQLQRKLKALTDRNPSQVLREYRLARAAEKLLQGMQVGLVAETCGFSSASRFSKSFKEHYGQTPKQYQSGALVSATDQ